MRRRSSPGSAASPSSRSARSAVSPRQRDGLRRRQFRADLPRRGRPRRRGQCARAARRRPPTAAARDFSTRRADRAGLAAAGVGRRPGRRCSPRSPIRGPRREEAAPANSWSSASAPDSACFPSGDSPSSPTATISLTVEPRFGVLRQRAAGDTRQVSDDPVEYALLRAGRVHLRARQLDFLTATPQTIVADIPASQLDRHDRGRGERPLRRAGARPRSTTYLDECADAGGAVPDRLPVRPADRESRGLDSRVVDRGVPRHPWSRRATSSTPGSCPPPPAPRTSSSTSSRSSTDRSRPSTRTFRSRGLPDHHHGTVDDHDRGCALVACT